MKSKQERIAAAVAELNSADEYQNFAMSTHLMREYNLTASEVDNIMNPAPIPAPNASGYCHYCGMPAKSYGAFDEPVCSDCGG